MGLAYSLVMRAETMPEMENVLAREYAWARRLLGSCRALARRRVSLVRRLILRPALLGSGSR